MTAPVALVTGGSGGIGRATTLALAAIGFDIAVHFNANAEKADAVAAEIRRMGRQAETYAADLCRTGAPDSLIGAVTGRFNRLDLLVNNAGGYRRFDHFRDLDDEEWDYAMTLNAKVPLWLCRAAWPFLEQAARDAGSGRIVNVSSNSVKYPSPNAVHYRAAKAALEAITASLAKAGASCGILVNAVRPGVIATGMQANLVGYDETRLQSRIGMIPMGRAGTAEEVAALIAFLAGSGAAYITGQTFAVAGGE
jgi:NAD(P)-dependent dehydrogenase (short-subunit alcohol dehydrogenase family)